MPRFLAIHSLPMTAEQFQEAVKKFKWFPTIIWHGTLVAEKDQKLFAEYEAPSSDQISNFLKGNNLPYDSIHEVTRVGRSYEFVDFLRPLK